jgi:DNA integrity scanning protein DisA with diadenylate cyclase activity
MRNTIDLFMWGFQQHIQISLKVSAESLFNQIDPELKPRLFLLGILTENRTDRHPVCLEPEECGYSVDSFQEVNGLAKQLEKLDAEGNIFHSHPVAQQNHNQRISVNAQIEAITKILTKEDLYGDTEKFVSYPTFVEGYLVFVVLEIDKQALNNHYSLTKTKMDERFKISRSFIESAIDSFLKECSIALKDPNKGIMAIERPAEELMRESGRLFMYSISQAGKNFHGLHGLYDACNSISSLRYEGAEGLGKIIIAKKDHPNIRFTLQLKEPIPMNENRKVRKFLELSNDSSQIICDSELIYGLGEQTGKYNPKEESLFVINFISHHKWEVSHENNTMMVVEYYQPNLPKERISRTKFYGDLKRIFTDIDKNRLDDLWDIVSEAIKQSHGTMLVITDNAEAESKRLGKQCFPINPIKLSSAFVKQASSIDGSILLDKNSTCYAIGVILDGQATEKGDSSRGARYNSAIRYYEQFGKTAPTVLVIISEDGMINLIPNLKPQIKHSSIKEMISALEVMSNSDEIRVRDFNSAISFLKNVEFYLSAEECETINHLRKAIEAKHLENANIKIVYRDLSPNNEMNESYYID